MEQLKLDLFPYRSKTVSKGENEIISWFHNVSEDKDKICYHESIYVKNQNMNLEDWLYIKRQNLGKLSLEYFYSYLKEMKRERFELLKEFLAHKKIVYETGSWENFEYN
tara:strand:- start:1112 stop:1438 length:327 start_codon:yes stop_codon:yes gene_type:complete